LRKSDGGEEGLTEIFTNSRKLRGRKGEKGYLGLQSPTGKRGIQ